MASRWLLCWCFISAFCEQTNICKHKHLAVSYIKNQIIDLSQNSKGSSTHPWGTLKWIFAHLEYWPSIQNMLLRISKIIRKSCDQTSREVYSHKINVLTLCAKHDRKLEISLQMTFYQNYLMKHYKIYDTVQSAVSQLIYHRNK